MRGWWIVILCCLFACKKESPPPIASLSVSSDPAGAKIFFEGRDTGRVTPAVMNDIAVGPELVVQVKQRGTISVPAEERIRFKELGEHQSAHFVLEPARIFRVTTVPNGAKLTFNGQELSGRTPLELPEMRRTASATITATADGHLPGKIVIKGSATSSVVELKLEPSQQIEVLTEPVSARIFVDGVLAGSAPVIAAVPLERKFVLRAERLGYKPFQKTLDTAKLKSRFSIQLTELSLLKLPLTKEERQEAAQRVAERDKAKRALAAAKIALKKAEKRAEAAQRQKTFIDQLAAAESAVDDWNTKVAELEGLLEEAENALEETRGNIFTRLDAEEQKKLTFPK